MKDIQILVEKQEIHDFMKNLWRSDLFKKSYEERGLVYQAVEQFSHLPRFFFRPSDDVENPHFSAWWGGIQRREYDQDAVHDLYYLHEIWHAGTMVYGQALVFENFARKMFENELEASVLSEMIIYYEMPDLRKQTFPYETFVDRFLFPQGFENPPDPAELESCRRNPTLTQKRLALARRNVMMAQSPNLEDDVEFWIQKFTHQNESWAHIWYARYNMMEHAMLQLIKDYKTMGRKDAMDKFMAWLTSDEVAQGTAIPFPDEAHAFYGMYALNKKIYKKTFERQRHAQPVSYLPPEVDPMPGL
jgi:hypothetical protein